MSDDYVCEGVPNGGRTEVRGSCRRCGIPIVVVPHGATKTNIVDARTGERHKHTPRSKRKRPAFGPMFDAVPWDGVA